jgi:hypothetical protein
MAKIRNRKGQGLVEYALIIAGVALIAAVAVSMFGHKVTDLIGTVAAILPGGHADDNAPITAGQIINTATVNGAVGLDLTTIQAQNNGKYDRIDQTVFGVNDVESPFLQEPGAAPAQ